MNLLGMCGPLMDMSGKWILYDDKLELADPTYGRTIIVS